MEFYTLAKLAGKWGKSEEDILRLADEGKLTLSVWWSGKYYEDFPGRWCERGPLNDYVNLGAIYARKFLGMNADARKYDEGKKEIGGDCFRRDGVPITLFIPYQVRLTGYDIPPEEKATTVSSPMFALSDIRILAEEMARFETEHPDLIGINDREKKSGRDCDQKPIRGWADLEGASCLRRNTILSRCKYYNIPIEEKKPSLLPIEIVIIKVSPPRKNSKVKK